MSNRTLDEFTADSSESVTSDSSPEPTRDSGVYRQTDATPTSNRGDSSDEVDPRKLVDDPTLDEVRWYYRYSLAKTLVEKPVRDAFKNGFEVKNDPNGEIREMFDSLDYVEKYISAQIKARRDGFSLLYFILRDSSDGVHEEPREVMDVKAAKTFTLDDLYRGGISKHRIADKVPLEAENIEVRPNTGIVVNKDPTSPEYEEPIAYVLDFDEEVGEPTVIHASRCQHFVWNTEHDGDLEDDFLGEVEGDSVLLSLYHLVKGLMKGNWSAMQTVYRYSAQMYSLNLPEGAGEEAVNDAEQHFSNLNAKSELILPHPDYDVEQYGSDGQLDPSPYFEIIFDQLCATTEMTKSVLFGTQSGTVSGSETDIKNYFNKVERIRKTRFNRDLREFVEMVDEWTPRNLPNDFEISWNPMFRMSDLDRAEAMRTYANTGQMLINSFALTPDEVRSLMEQQWADIGIDFDLDELTDSDKEDLEWVNFGQRGLENEESEVSERKKENSKANGNQSEKKGNPRKQNSGGMPAGKKTASEQPATDNEESADDDTDEPSYEY